MVVRDVWTEGVGYWGTKLLEMRKKVWLFVVVVVVVCLFSSSLREFLRCLGFLSCVLRLTLCVLDCC